MYSKWFDEYHKKFPNIQFNYQSIGSGGGIQQVTAGTVDFGASDGPMTDEQIEGVSRQARLRHPAFPDRDGRGCSDRTTFPESRRSSTSRRKRWRGSSWARSPSGTIRRSPKANPGVKLPGSDIVVVHRSDGSGTTYVWTDYLSKVSKEWETKVGRGTSVNWPVGLGGKGNEGVSGQVKQTPNSIGYVELIYAVQNKMPYGKVKNAAGEFVQASLASVTAAAASAAKDDAGRFPGLDHQCARQGRLSDFDFTWLLIPEKIADPAKKKAITDFLNGC